VREVFTFLASCGRLLPAKEGKLKSIEWDIAKGFRTVAIKVPGVVPPLSLKPWMGRVIAREVPLIPGLSAPEGGGLGSRRTRTCLKHTERETQNYHYYSIHLTT
jgi:hypothetical protein